MQQHPAHEKLRLLRRVLRDGEPVSRICEEAKIPRKTFYQWKRRYVSGGERGRLSRLQRRERLRRGSLVGTRGFRAALLNVIVRHPNWSLRRCAKTLRDRGYTASHMSVARQLRGLGLESIPERETFSRLHSFRKRVIDRYERRHRWLLPEARKMMVEEALRAGRAVGEICRDYRVSRKTFYKWKARYLASIDDVTRLPLVASQADRHLRGSRHPLSLPSPVRDRILGVIAAKPALSYREIARVVGGVSHRGVGNFLLREGLNTKERRLAWAAGRVVEVPMGVQLVTAWVGRLKQVLEQFIPTRAPLGPPFGVPRGKPLFWLRRLSISLLLSISIFFLLFSWGQFLGTASSTSQALGFGFASLALTMGTAFFLYSLKYYFTLAVVLSFSREASEPATSDVQKPPTSDVRFSKARSWLGRLFGIASSTSERTTSDVEHAFTSDVSISGQAGGLETSQTGLTPDLTRVTLERHPFVSVHIPMYNEPKVAERVLRACTGFSYQGPYEVIVADDSTDETTAIVQEFAARWNAPPSDFTSDVKGIPTSDVSAFGRPQIKVIHRETREGFKGGALREALKATDPRAEFVVVFDADFVPYPDTLELFLKYFQVNSGSLNPKTYTLNPIAAIQGYQWHVLNKSENWITRGVRSEYAGSYVIERSGAELYGGLKQIAGSVYMIRRDLLETFGWGTSLTEDFELTLRLYGAGYRVVYTPYIQAPAECASTLKRLIRQRMRWAEGHSFNIRRMFARLLFGGWVTGEVENAKLKAQNAKLQLKTQSSIQENNRTVEQYNNYPSQNQNKVWIPSPLSLSEKLEFLYLSPYYLQAAFFLLGTLSWLISETIFKARLPFWTNVWGWSLVLTNLISLPLMNMVGLFLEEAEEKDFAGTFSFILLTYLLIPFQAYASVKGFLEQEEGPWFRTPKTGNITDVLTRGRFYRFIRGIFPSLRPFDYAQGYGGQAGRAQQAAQFLISHPYLSLATANSRFDNFKIRPKKLRWIGKVSLVVLLIISLNIVYLSSFVPLVFASPGTQIKTVEYFITQYASSSDIASGNGVNGSSYTDANDISFNVNLPESGTLTIRHAYVEWRTLTGNQSVASGEMKFDRATCSGSRTNTTLTLGAATATSNESYRLIYRMDVTAEMAAGSNNYCFNAQITGTSLVRNADNAKLIVSYEYDDTATTQLRTRKYFVACGTGTGTPTSGTVNPNIAESGATVKSAWVEYTGHFYSSANGEGSVSIDINSNNGSEVNTDDDTVTSYDIFVTRDVTANVNLNSNNTIDLDHTTQLIANKCAELVITYSFSPYAATPGLQGSTVVYAIGQNRGDLPGSQTTIGAAREVIIPEASLSYDKIWVRYWFIGDAASNVTPKVLTSRDATGTTGSAYSIPAPTELAGKYNILFDITTYFSNASNFQSGDTVTVQAQDSVAGDHMSIGAELVISYRHDQTGASLTGQKTVYWLVGQKVTAGSSDQTGSFTTYLPETETRRSSAVVMDAPKGIIAATIITDTVTAGSTTCNAASTDTTLTDFTGTGENMTTKMLDVTGTNSMTNMAGEAVSFCLGVGSTINDTVGAVAYTTFTASIPTLPENLFPFLILLVLLPKAVQLAMSENERRKWGSFIRRKEYTLLFKSLADPYKVLYMRLIRMKIL